MSFIYSALPAPSRNPHAFFPDTFTTRPHYEEGYLSWTAEAVWLGRKDRRTTVSFGRVNGVFIPNNPDSPELDEALAAPPRRFYSSGGSVQYRWNGYSLWIDPGMKTDLDRLPEIVSLLDHVYTFTEDRDFTPPEDTIGWFYPEKAER